MRYLSVLLLLANAGWADTVVFRDGHTVNGSFLGGDSRNIRVAVGDRVESIRVADVDQIMFGGDQAVSAPGLRYPPEERRAEAPPPPPPGRRERDDFAGRMIPSGTVLTISIV